MDEPKGKHDGRRNKIRYFKCKQGHGIWARADGIKLLETPQNQKHTKASSATNTFASQWEQEMAAVAKMDATGKQGLSDPMIMVICLPLTFCFASIVFFLLVLFALNFFLFALPLPCFA